MLNSKYSKVLTVILIIAIIAIVGLLIFVGIDLYKAYTTNADVDDFDSQFNGFIENVAINNNQDPESNVQFQNSVDQNTDLTTDPEIQVNTESNTSSSGGSSSSGSSSAKKLTYKGFNVLGRIEIPKTDVKYYLLEEYSPKALETSVVVIYGPGPNEVGNTVIAGHNYRNGTFFSNNKKLEDGDKIYITDLTGKKVTYEIYKHYITDENDFSYAVRDTEGRREISLSTCTDDSKNRLIIWAKEK